MFTIQKEFSFSAAHHLTGVPDGHPCQRVHGHNYKVQLVLRGKDVNPTTNFLVDYNDLRMFGQYLDATFDHRDLNDIFENPTAECLAFDLYTWAKKYWPETYAVRVSETDKTWAEYSE